MSTAPGRIMGKPSIKALRKRLSGRVADHPGKTRAISAVGILFPGPDMQVVSGLSCPVGFKIGTSGDVQIAIEAVRSAAHPRTFIGHSKHGQSAIFVTLGNPDGHVILRGGRTTPNYNSASVAHACALLENAGWLPLVMIDCSHANRGKDHTKQPLVCRDALGQITTGDRRNMGVIWRAIWWREHRNCQKGNH